MAGGCDSVTRLLSPYVDDELSGPDRALVEGHLKGCAPCTQRLADLSATQAAMSAYFTQRAEAADFSKFTANVLATIKKEPLPLGQRVRLWWAEVMNYHATTIYSAFGAAALAAVVAVLVLGRPTPGQVAISNEMVVHSLKVQDPRYEPVVMHTDDGETVIMLVEHTKEPDDDQDQPAGTAAPTGEKVKPGAVAEPPHGGNL